MSFAELFTIIDPRSMRLEASVAVFHQRFSTNTLPQWRLAHPFRYLAHNGEINTVQGNRNWALARGPLFRSPVLPDLSDIQPVVSLTGCQLKDDGDNLVNGKTQFALIPRAIAFGDSIPKNAWPSTSSSGE